MSDCLTNILIGFVAKSCLNLAIGKRVYVSKMANGSSEQSAVDGLKDWHTAPMFAAYKTKIGETWVAIDMGHRTNVGSVHFHNYPHGKSGCVITLSPYYLHSSSTRDYVRDSISIAIQ